MPLINNKYTILESLLSILKPAPIVYGGRTYEVNIDVLMEELDHNPVQLAAFSVLSKMNVAVNNKNNPLGELIFMLYNPETTYDTQYSMTVRQDLENAAYELSKATTEYTNEFLFNPFNDLDNEEKVNELERLAIEITQSKDETELREVLIFDLLYHALSYNFDDWPPSKIW